MTGKNFDGLDPNPAKAPSREEMLGNFRDLLARYHDIRTHGTDQYLSGSIDEMIGDCEGWIAALEALDALRQ